MAPPGDGSEEPPASRTPQNSARITELSDSLGVQRAILASLRDLPPEGETIELVAEAEAELGRIQKELARERGQSQTLTYPSRPASQKNKGKMNNWPAQDLGNSWSFSGLSTPTGMSTSSASSSSAPNQNRKRDYSTHLDGAEDIRRENKSRRATPSPLDTALTTPSTGDVFDVDFGDDVESVIDLTGDDAALEQLIKAQREAEERFRKNRALAERDAEIARLMAQEGGYVSGGPSSLTSGPSGPSERTAFDRMLGRSFQASQPSSSQGLSSQSDRPPTAATGSGHVPGAFIDSDDEDLGFPEDFNGHPSSWGPTARPTASSSLSTPARPTGPGSGPSRFGAGGPAAELARQAALARPNGPSPVLPPFGSSGGSPYSSVYGGQTQAPTLNPSRPGSIQNGSYAPLQDWGSRITPSSLLGDRPGDTLSNIIDLTSNYDYTNLLNNSGFPLDERYRRIFGVDEDPAQTEKEIKDLLQNIRPDEEFSEEDRIGTPEGLRYPLYTHQRLALQWMVKMEEGSNKGGILADDMGLGKTISTLALLLSRPPPDRVKTNLIVGPVALIKQWESEIRKKIKPNHSLSVFLYHGNRNVSYSELRTFDVILTTYGKLGQQYKRYADWKNKHPDADAGADSDLAKNCPLVHSKSKFFRVILDEAQCIKNKETLAAKAACSVITQHRWCLTGTPMMNGVQELYSLINFLRIRPYNVHKEFQKTFGSLAPSRFGKNSSEVSRDVAMGKLRVLLKAIMLRRMKNSEIDGKPILNLPPKSEEVVHAVFSEDERSFYRDLETKTQTQFNKYLRAGTVGKHYSNVLVLLLRLRQACCHPHLNLDVEYVANSEVSVDTMIKLAKDLAPNVVARLKEMEAFECPICYDAVADPSIVIPCGHDTCSECLTMLTERSAENNLRAGDEGSGAKCPQCRGPIHTDKIINYSTFKKVHMPTPSEGDDETAEDDVSTASEDDSTASEDETDSEDEDDVDRNGNLKDFIVNDDDIETASEADDDGDDDFLAEASSSKKEKKQKKSKSKSKGKSKKSRKGKEKAEEVKPHMLKTLRLEARKNKDTHRRYMRYLRKNWQTSAKVTECCEVLKKIQESGEKTIVFSQFTLLLDLLEIPIKYELGIKYCRYDGGMSRNQRDAAATDFQDPASRTKVMLVSLKAGNAGLNLTAASQVIIMDPFWNPYIEMQAVDRAYRIGQQKPVQVHRILVEETVEDRIIELQEKKRALVDAALDEGESRNLGRLTTSELAYLFGVSSRR